uniref:Ribosomal protein S11 n=1 Tax=Eucheuma denticulatum TaxID=305493 RepID=A0A2H4QI68_9FLOR|nr:ribosomal protein S11 [Eucheuma denticulatum]ATX68861.1 ribosomal protein S11 [Eucheuma denticulatum]
MPKNKLIIISMLFTPNNIFYSVNNIEGEVLFWTSLGSSKTKGSKKITSTSVAFNLKNVKEFLDCLNYSYVFIKVRGFNRSKKHAIKILRQSLKNVVLIHDETFFPHNGCKKSKIRCL